MWGKDVLVTTRQSATQSRASATVWQGRASDHRRRQVRDLGPERVQEGPTGPVDAGCREPLGTPDTLTSIEAVWGSVVDVLDALGAPSSALLCTASGFPLKAYGYEHRDLVPAARVAGSSFALRRGDTVPNTDVVTVEMVAGMTQTVMTAIPSAQGEHLLTVTADAVSMPVLTAWTRHVAGQLRRVLAQA